MASSTIFLVNPILPVNNNLLYGNLGVTHIILQPKNSVLLCKRDESAHSVLNGVIGVSVQNAVGDQTSSVLNVQSTGKPGDIFNGSSDLQALQSATEYHTTLTECNETVCVNEPKDEKPSQQWSEPIFLFSSEKVKVEDSDPQQQQFFDQKVEVNMQKVSLDNHAVPHDADISTEPVTTIKVEKHPNDCELNLVNMWTETDFCSKAEMNSTDNVNTVTELPVKKVGLSVSSATRNLKAPTSKYRQTDISSFWPKEEEVPPELLKEIDVLKKLYVNNKCLICGFSSKSKRATSGWHNAKHMLVHLATKCYKCDKCDKTFINSQRLMTHSIIHMNVYPFTCSTCGKRFRRKVDWSLHCERKHTEVRIASFNCSVCSKAFASKTEVRRHYRTHTGEKPFYCSECNQGFCKRDSLDTHMNKHKGIRPYDCNECGKSFSNRKYLRYHMNLHSKRTTFECKECHMTFNFKSNLAQHMKTHSEQRSHKCDQCGKLFKLPHHLRQHLSTHESSSRTNRRKRRKVIDEESGSCDENVKELEQIKSE